MSRFLNIYFSSYKIEESSSLLMKNICTAFILLPLINEALAELVAQWNDHPVTTKTNLSPLQLWTQGMLRLRNSNLTTVRDIVDGIPANTEEFGIEEEGPVSTSHPDSIQGVSKKSEQL